MKTAFFAILADFLKSLTFQNAITSFKLKMGMRFIYTLIVKGGNFQNPLKPPKKVPPTSVQVTLKFWKFWKSKLKKSAVAVITWHVEKSWKCYEWIHLMSTFHLKPIKLNKNAIHALCQLIFCQKLNFSENSDLN